MNGAPNESSLSKTVQVLLFFVLIVFILKQLEPILQPFFTAIFLIYVTLPLKALFRRIYVPEKLLNWAVMIVVILFLFSFGCMVSENMQTLSQNYPDYKAKFMELVGRFTAYAATFDPKIQDSIRRFDVPFAALAKTLGQGLGSAFSIIAVLMLVGLYLIFIFLELNTFDKRLQAAFGASKERKIEAIISKINTGIFAYIRVKTVVSMLAAGFCTVILIIFHVDLWLFWGFLIFLGNFIPYIGSLIAILFPTSIFLLQTGSLWQTLILGVSLAIAKNAIEAFVEPKMAGRALNLSPLVVILSLAFWAWLWGIVGMILSIPIMVAIKTLLDAFPETESYARLMEERVKS